MIRTLGRAAAAARRLGLQRPVRAALRLADFAFVRAGRPPLRAHVDGAVVAGYLRHRSFLAEAMRPRATYAELFQRLLQPGMTVVDGGAHVGLFSVLAARAVGEDGAVFAVEPDGYNLAALRANVRGLGNVVVVPEALSDAVGTARFYETRSTIGSSLITRGDDTGHDVRTTTIDTLLGDREVRSLLVKLNIEGAEPLAIAGMRSTLERVDEVALLIEVNPPLLAAAGTDVDGLFATLRRDGFAVEYVDLPTQQPVPLPTPLPKGHVLASKSARP